MKLAAFLLMGAVLLPMLATAGDGHDHGEAAPTAANPNAPQRLPDGSVFLPKKTQRFIQVRTQPAKLEALPRSLTLNGQVVAGVDASSKVQAARIALEGSVEVFIAHAGKQAAVEQALAGNVGTKVVQ